MGDSYIRTVMLTVQNGLGAQAKEGYHNSYYALLIGSFLITGKIALLLQPRAVYLTDLGMSLSLYGLLLGVGWGLMFFVQAAVGRLSDLMQSRKQITLICLMLDMVFMGAFLMTRNLTLLAVMFVLEVVCHSQIFQMMMTMLSDVANAKGYGASFGAYKAMGSFSWMIFAAISGAIFESYGFPVLMMGALIAQLAIIVLILKFKEPPLNVASSPNAAQTPALRLKALFTPALLAVCVLQLLITFQDRAGITYFFIYMTRDMALSASFAGIVSAIAGLFEIPLTLLGGKLFDRLNPKTMITWGCLIGVTRWIFLPFIHNPYLLFLIQVQHAVIITAMFVGIPSYIASQTPPQYRGTMFGLQGSISSIGATAGPAVIGGLGDMIGLGNAMIINGLVGVLGVVSFVVLLSAPRILAKFPRLRREHACACRQ